MESAEKLERITEKTTFTLHEDNENVINKNTLKKKNVFIRQLWAFSGCFLLTVLSGAVSGYSAILLPQLELENSKIFATNSQQSWIASMAPLLMAVGCLVSGWSLEYFGRLKTLKYCTVIFLLGWIIIYLSKTIECLLVGRIITGFCGGYLGPVASCYISEITTPIYRGMFLAGICLGVALGLLITHIMGTFLEWQTVALIICTGPVIIMLILQTIPESHIWLVSKGRYQEAQAALQWYTSENDSTTLEYCNTNQYETHDKLNFRRLLRREFIKPVIIMNLFFITAQCSGNNAVVFYSVAVMQRTVPTLNKYAAMIIIDAIRVIMSVVACILTKKYKVRALTTISAIGTILSLYLLAIFAHLSHLYPDNAVYSSVPLAFLVSYIIFISIGIVPLPWSLSGELLPPQDKGIGGGFATSINFIAFFIVVKTSPDLFACFGNGIGFATYGTLTLICTAMLYFILPETKNKTLEEIQNRFKGNK